MKIFRFFSVLSAMLFCCALAAADYRRLNILQGELVIADTTFGDSSVRQAAFAIGMKNPKLKISINKMTLDAAVKAALDSKVNLLLLDAPLPARLRKRLKSTLHRYSADPAIFMVNASNPTKNISESMLRNVFSGDTISWEKINSKKRGIKLFGVKPGAPGAAAFVRRLMQGIKPAGRIFQLETAAGLEVMVGNNPNSIGFCGYLTPRSKKIKTIKVGGAAPTEQNIVSGKYPLVEFHYVCVPDNAGTIAKSFADLLISKDIVGLIRADGLLPATIKPKK